MQVSDREGLDVGGGYDVIGSQKGEFGVIVLFYSVYSGSYTNLDMCASKGKLFKITMWKNKK